MTIGDLERRAGIEQTPEARARFWKPFAHLEARAMLDAGREELQRIIEEKAGDSADPADGLTTEEQDPRGRAGIRPQPNKVALI